MVFLEVSHTSPVPKYSLIGSPFFIFSINLYFHNTTYYNIICKIHIVYIYQHITYILIKLLIYLHLAWSCYKMVFFKLSICNFHKFVRGLLISYLYWPIDSHVLIRIRKRSKIGHSIHVGRRGCFP